METLLEPTPRRSELVTLVGFAWVTGLSLLLGNTQGLRPEDLWVLVVWAAVLAAPVAAAVRATGRASTRRWPAVGGVVFVAVWALLFGMFHDQLPLGEAVASGAWVAAFSLVVGLVIHAPLLLLLRSIRSRGAARHRGREALVMGTVGALTLACLAARTRHVLVDPSGCACEGPVAAPWIAATLFSVDATLLAALTIASLLRGLVWEARLRPLVRRALVDAPPGWRAGSYDGSVPDAKRLALDAAAAWVPLLSMRASGEADAYRTAALQGPGEVFVPSRVRRLGVTQVLHALLIVGVVGLCGVIARQAVEVARLPHEHIGP